MTIFDVAKCLLCLETLLSAPKYVMLYPPSVIITLILCTVYDRTVVSLFKADRTVYITIINTTVIEIVLPHYFVSKMSTRK